MTLQTAWRDQIPRIGSNGSNGPRVSAILNAIFDFTCEMSPFERLIRNILLDYQTTLRRETSLRTKIFIKWTKRADIFVKCLITIRIRSRNFRHRFRHDNLERDGFFWQTGFIVENDFDMQQLNGLLNDIRRILINLFPVA